MRSFSKAILSYKKIIMLWFKKIDFWGFLKKKTLRKINKAFCKVEGLIFKLMYFCLSFKVSSENSRTKISSERTSCEFLEKFNRVVYKINKKSQTSRSQARMEKLFSRRRRTQPWLSSRIQQKRILRNKISGKTNERPDRQCHYARRISIALNTINHDSPVSECVHVFSVINL